MDKSTECSGPQHRNVVYCLICEKPQKMISVHLTRTCMKDRTPAEIKAEVKRARESHRKFGIESRVVDCLDLIKDHPTTYPLLINYLKERGHFFINKPSAIFTSPAIPSVAPPAASVSTETTASVAPDTSSQESEENIKEDDPTWQRPQQAFTSTVRVQMEKHGLYQKFPENTRLISGFKDHLINMLHVPNCQQEVDNVTRYLKYVQPDDMEPTFDFLFDSEKGKGVP
ncbi:uncharacterized protein LOC120520504 [Polypterus senegalus]|uniref:uncharacterized protein LOC120520504 n=1 Tax=Polypterus senegalus TaxID=55291 RepID=UPI00196575C0|nr:uncharacterized protein LOC120520504 [Polypterus senegalus]